MHCPPECRIIESSDPCWLEYISSKPDANIFHHPAWINLVSSVYQYQPFILVHQADTGQIDGGIPLIEVNSLLTGKRWISLPFSDYCNPLFENSTVLDQLLEWLLAEHVKNQAPRIELRWGIASDGIAKQAQKFVRQIIPLDPDPDKVEARCERVHKQNVRAAAKRGVEIVWGRERRHLDQYYALQLETRRRLGVPVQPYLYFKQLGSSLLEQNFGSILLAYHGDVCIAGLVLLHWNRCVVAKYAASQADRWNLRPNNLLFWEAIRWACEQGYACFDMGRTEVENSGLRRYKKGWGAFEEPLAYSTIGTPATPPSGGVTGKLLGSLIRHSPNFVCEVIGKMFYKHFA